MTITAKFTTDDGAEFNDELEAQAHDDVLSWATGYVAERCGFKSDARLRGRAHWLAAAIEAHQDHTSKGVLSRDPNDETAEVVDADVADLRPQTDEGIAA